MIKRISYDNYVIFQADFCWGDLKSVNSEESQ